MSATHNGDPEQLSRTLIGAAIEVHRLTGPGLLECVYEECLSRELALRGLRFERQHSVSIMYKGQPVGTNLRCDLLVEDTVVVELKAVEKLLPVHEAQVLTYLRLMRKPMGLLMNFNVPVMKDGLVRLLNGYFPNNDPATR